MRSCHGAHIWVWFFLGGGGADESYFFLAFLVYQYMYCCCWTLHLPPRIDTHASACAHSTGSTQQVHMRLVISLCCRMLW